MKNDGFLSIGVKIKSPWFFLSHIHLFLESSQRQFQNIGKQCDAHGDEYKQSVANMSEVMQSFQDQGSKAAEEELDTTHTDCRPLPQQPCLAECGLSWACDDW